MAIIRRSEVERAYSIPAHINVREGLMPHETDPHKRADEKIAKDVYNVLYQHYPGQPWAVMVSSKQGVARVMLPCFTAYSMVIHLSTLNSDPRMRSVVRAGGEFLERYRIPRSGFSTPEFVRAMKTYAPIGPRNKPPS